MKKIVSFYHRVKSPLSFRDQLKQIQEIIPFIWEDYPLFFVDKNDQTIFHLNKTFEQNITDAHTFINRLPANPVHFPSKRTEGQEIWLYTPIALEDDANGWLVTVLPQSDEPISPLEYRFGILSLWMIQNAIRSNSVQLSKLHQFVMEIEQICLSSFDKAQIMERLFRFLPTYFPDFHHTLYYFHQQTIVEFGFHSQSPEFYQTEIIHPQQKNELLALYETFHTLFQQIDPFTVMAKMEDQNGRIALFRIRSPYQNFWTPSVQVYYSILIQTLMQTLSRIALVEKIENDRQELRSLVQFKKDITSMIAHDMSSPIMGIIGYLGIIRGFEDEIPGKILQFINKAYRLSMRLNKLIEDFRFLNLTDVNKLTIHPQPVEMYSYLDNILKFYRDLYSCTFHFDHQEDQLWLSIDPDYFSHIVENLINNSIKYVGENVEITIRLLRDENTFLLDYHDNGPGIADEDLSVIFDKYTRLHSGKKVGGTGLGLYICKIITELHDGAIWAENSGGHTHFKISIPVMELKGNPPNI